MVYSILISHPINSRISLCTLFYIIESKLYGPGYIDGSFQFYSWVTVWIQINHESLTVNMYKKLASRILRIKFKKSTVYLKRIGRVIVCFVGKV